MNHRMGLGRVFSLLATLTLAVTPLAYGGSRAGEFHLVEGHSGRRELAFTVSSPGPIEVQVESTTPGVELYAMVIHHANTVHNVQGSGRIRYDFTADGNAITQSREWAVLVQAVTPGQEAHGRITVRFPDGAPHGVHALDTWLYDHPAIGTHLQWSDAQGTRSYSAWPTAMKERLWQYFDLIRSGQPPSLPDPPRNAWNYGPGDDPLAVHTLLTTEDALNLYLATVAHSLVLEVDRRVPWSLDDANETELEALFSSSFMFWWNERQQGFEIASLRHGWAVPAPPQVGWEFLRDQGLLRGTRLETIAALVGWCKGLTHFAGGVMPDNFEAFWGYRGDMPVSRALVGTRYSGTELSSYPGFDQMRHYTAGCHGTVGLLVNVLRSANIPATYRAAGDDRVSHATVIFLSEDRALTHGDDPYNQLCTRVPPEELLLDLPTYNAWLGPLAPNPLPNIGRQALVAGLRHLSPAILRSYEKDKASGASHGDGEVFETFRSAFSLQELEASRLWERMDSELANGGGAP